MKSDKSRNTAFAALKWLALCVSFLFAQTVIAQASLQNVSFAGLPGDQLQIDLQFDQAPPKPEAFVIDQPARLTLDFANTRSNLKERRYPLNHSIGDSLMVLEAQGKMRLVVNLNTSQSYTTSVRGNTMSVVIGKAAAASATTVLSAASGNQAQSNRFVSPVTSGKDIEKLDFRRGDKNAGMVVVDLAKSSLNAKVTQTGSRLLLEFANASISPSEQVRLDVTDFGTPVRDVSMYLQDGKVVVQANVTGQYEYLAYQTDRQYVLSVTPVVAGNSVGGAAQPEKQFEGERIDLDFQSIDIRAVLQILADFNDFNLIVSPSVSGNVTLRMDNVPWDQAVDLVLRSNKLGKRIDGNVLYIAPADEIASSEVAALESNQKVEELAPLVTEYIAINYAKADELVTLLQADKDKPGIMTPRGKAAVDARTNTIILQDIEPALVKVKALIAKLDVPVKSVLIEARIVNASTSFSQAMGIKWGGAQRFPAAGDRFLLSGSMESSIEYGTNLSEYVKTINDAVAGGQSLETALATNIAPGVTFPDALAVDMGVAAPSSIALGYAGSKGLLELELQALEASGNGEVIAQPKITTQDQKEANITSGLQIPYQSQAGGTAGGTTTSFVTAALTLQVTPQITPDGNIIMKLKINQDSVVPGSGAVPAIATNSVTTNVLVNNGDTVVLGGVYREEVTTSTTKTPLLGDLPYVGNLFKKKEESKSKTELLIFITPSVINDLK